MKQDKFLTGILVGVGVLVVAAVGLFFLRQDEQTYMAEDTPDGVAHNYVLAIQMGDYDRAYGYLAEVEGKPDKLSFTKFFSNRYRGETDAGVQIMGYELVEMDNGREGAVVDLSIMESYGGLFGERHDYEDIAVLVKQGGEWKITQMPYQFWDWGWYRDNAVLPVPPDISGEQ